MESVLPIPGRWLWSDLCTHMRNENQSPLAIKRDLLKTEIVIQMNQGQHSCYVVIDP